jgi:hypothetical protein
MIPGLASLFRTGTEVACAEPDMRKVASIAPANAAATPNLVFMVQLLQTGLFMEERQATLRVASPAEE